MTDNNASLVVVRMPLQSDYIGVLHELSAGIISMRRVRRFQFGNDDLCNVFVLRAIAHLWPEPAKASAP